MSILVFLEQGDGKIVKGSLCALSAARAFAAAAGIQKINGVLLGAGAKAAAEGAKNFGLSSIYVAESADFVQYRSAPYAAAFAKAFELSSASVGVALASTTGKDFMPRVAVQLDAGQASDIIGVNSDGTLQRPMYAGDVIADVELKSERKLITVRGSAFDAANPEASPAGEVIELSGVEIPAYSGEIVSFDASGGDRPELADAEIVVSGGRAMASGENFEKVIFPLADVLGAAVGASRAAVDSGYAPNDWQVGQTGKIVAPKLYIAVGISGAIQHLAGMKDSKVIVAINKDADAPIFEIADYGLVADLFEAVPQLTEAVKAARG
ncbi:MAG: electron transfer flavoprotein subunit alpha/FixB family protein [Bdellovibrionales bacterium]|nr:electron transfer flavoprotein subunit alpha/FixB family protein [Bdellovibrionales bacterium]